MTDLETENRFFLSAFCAVYFVFPSEHSFKDIFLILSHIQVTEELTVRHADNTDREEQVKQISCSFTHYNYSVDSIRRSISGDNTTRGIHNALKTHTKNTPDQQINHLPEIATTAESLSTLTTLTKHEVSPPPPNPPPLYNHF